MGLLITWITLALGLFVADKLIPDFELKGDWKSFVLIAAVLGVLHWLIGWLIYVILGLATLGLGFLFSFLTKLVVTAIVLKIVDALSRRVTIRGFLPAFLGALVLAATSGVVEWLRR